MKQQEDNNRKGEKTKELESKRPTMVLTFGKFSLEISGALTAISVVFLILLFLECLYVLGLDPF